MLNLNLIHYNYWKNEKQISWEGRLPQELIKPKIKRLFFTILLLIIADFLFLLLITNYNILLSILLILVFHVSYFLIFVIFHNEYHRYHFKKKYLNDCRIAINNQIILSPGELKLKERLENSNTNYFKIYGYFIYITLLFLFIIIIDLYSLYKAIFFMLLLMPILSSKMYVDYSEFIRTKGNVDIKLDEKKISIYGTLNLEYLEEFEFSDIKKIWLVETYNNNSKWRILNIVFLTNAFRFPSNGLYSKNKTTGFMDLFRILENEISENKNLAHIELKMISQESYFSKREKLKQKSARVFI